MSAQDICYGTLLYLLLSKARYELLIEMQKSLLYDTKSLCNSVPRIITPPLLLRNCKDSIAPKTKIHRYPPIRLRSGQALRRHNLHQFYLYQISHSTSMKIYAKRTHNQQPTGNVHWIRHLLKILEKYSFFDKNPTLDGFIIYKNWHLWRQNSDINLSTNIDILQHMGRVTCGISCVKNLLWRVNLQLVRAITEQ